MTQTAEHDAPAAPLDRDERAELLQLREMRDDLARPVLALAAELAHLRDVAHTAQTVCERAERHGLLGYSRIRLGVFDALRTALANSPRYVAASEVARPAEDNHGPTLDDLRTALAR